MSEDLFFLTVSIGLVIIWLFLLSCMKKLSIDVVTLYDEEEVLLTENHFETDVPSIGNITTQFENNQNSFRRQKICLEYLLEQLLKTKINKELDNETVSCHSRIKHLRSIMELTTNMSDLFVSQIERLEQIIRGLIANTNSDTTTQPVTVNGQVYGPLKPSKKQKEAKRKTAGFALREIQLN